MPVIHWRPSRGFGGSFTGLQGTEKSQGTNKEMAPGTLFFPARGTFHWHMCSPCFRIKGEKTVAETTYDPDFLYALAPAGD
jgi:hypothetical protein